MTNVSYFVRYEGRAGSPESFVSYYRENHVPILIRFPGIKKIILHMPVPSNDPFSVNPDRFELIAQMVFESREALDRALQSKARAEAREDFGRFPSFGGAVFHQATLSEQVFPE